MTLFIPNAAYSTEEYSFTILVDVNVKDSLVLKGFSSRRTLTPHSQSRNCLEQQGSEYPMVKIVMQFLLYARGGGGGEGVSIKFTIRPPAPPPPPPPPPGVSIKFTMRHRSKVQPLILLYTYTIFDTEKVPLLYTLF